MTYFPLVLGMSRDSPPDTDQYFRECVKIYWFQGKIRIRVWKSWTKGEAYMGTYRFIVEDNGIGKKDYLNISLNCSAEGRYKD